MSNTAIGSGTMDCPLCRLPVQDSPAGEGRTAIDCSQCGHLDIEDVALERLVADERLLARVFAARARQMPPGSRFVIRVRRTHVGRWARNTARIVGTVEERIPEPEGDGL